jgi:hypothetical protein
MAAGSSPSSKLADMSPGAAVQLEWSRDRPSAGTGALDRRGRDRPLAVAVKALVTRYPLGAHLAVVFGASVCVLAAFGLRRLDPCATATRSR